LSGFRIFSDFFNQNFFWFFQNSDFFEFISNFFLTIGGIQQQKHQQNYHTNGGGILENQQEENLLNQQFDQQIKLDDFICVRCNDGFIPSETVVNSGGQFWHAECFV